MHDQNAKDTASLEIYLTYSFFIGIFLFLSRNITPLTIRKHGTAHLATIEYNEENELSILNAPLIRLSSQIPYG